MEDQQIYDAIDLLNTLLEDLYEGLVYTKKEDFPNKDLIIKMIYKLEGDTPNLTFKELDLLRKYKSHGRIESVKHSNEELNAEFLKNFKKF